MTGRVQVYTGDGKGKTTAAVGLAIRALGAGKRVFIGQFIKGKPSGEILALTTRFEMCESECFGTGRFIRGVPGPDDIAAAHRGLARLVKVVSQGKHDVVIADEINGAVSAGVISIDEQLVLLEERAPHVELVMTGRDAHERLVGLADLVTEMTKVKHYFDDGVPSREGIEY